MKREIKFRAYRKSTQNICDVLSIDFEKGLVLLDDGDEEDIPAVELMQYTGLHDKNGREIYEGDIVKNEYGQVMDIQYDPRSAAFGVGDYYFGTIGSGKILEVIGNIFEDKQLLEGEQ